jgi:hypothetical protein
VATNRAAAEPSATSVARSDTLPATATRVDSNKVDINRVASVKVNRPVILAVVTDTCPETAPRDRSATTADRSAISAVIAQVSKTVFATSMFAVDVVQLSYTDRNRCKQPGHVIAFCPESN